MGGGIGPDFLATQGIKLTSEGIKVCTTLLRKDRNLCGEELVTAIIQEQNNDIRKILFKSSGSRGLVYIHADCEVCNAPMSIQVGSSKHTKYAKTGLCPDCQIKYASIYK